MFSSLPALVMLTLPPGAPPPLGDGPQALPHAPMFQSDRIGVALQLPASVGASARAERGSAHNASTTRSWRSGKRRIERSAPHARRRASDTRIVRGAATVALVIEARLPV